LKKILKIAAEIPSNWQERIAPKIHGLVLDWLVHLPLRDKPQIANSQIKQGDMLRQYLFMPSNTAQVLFRANRTMEAARNQSLGDRL